MRGTWHCLTTGCTIHGEGEWKAVNSQAERHGKAESHSTIVAYIYPPELGKYPPERYKPSAQQQRRVLRYVTRLINYGKGHPDPEFDQLSLGQVALRIISAALDPDPADRGTEEGS